MTAAEFPGDVDHPEHEQYLLELGRATFAAARLTGIAFDVLRVHGGADAAALYADPLGALENRLRQAPPAVAGFEDFLTLLGKARIDRNDLVHALPVKHGLHRRLTRRDAPDYLRDFFTVESLTEVRLALEAAQAKGSEVLYVDGGAAARRWYGNEARSASTQ